MGLLDGVSNSLKKVQPAVDTTTNKTPTTSTSSSGSSIFQNSKTQIGDKLELNTNTVKANDSGNYYIEVDQQKNSTLLDIVGNAYNGWEDLNDDERTALVDIVMDANPEIYGTSVNNVSGQYVTDSDRNSTGANDDYRSQRLNTIIKEGDKINIPTLDPTIDEDSVKILNAAETNNEGDVEHIHVGTLIATPHDTQEFVYEPDAKVAFLSAEDGSVNTLASVVAAHFDTEADPQKAYAIALDQAKANSDLVLERINEKNGTSYDDVATIPQDVLLNTNIYSEKENVPNELVMVESRYEDSTITNSFGTFSFSL